MPSKGGGKHKLKVKKVTAIAQHFKVFRALNPELGVLTWGVHHSLYELATVPAQPLIMDGDFAAFAKQSIHNSGFNSSHLPSKFSVKEYCPLVFRDLRDRFGVDADMFLSSHCDEPAVFIDTPKKSQGALYRTHDSEYMIQTLSKEDVQNFHNVFASYHSYIVERHSQAADTLLPHYLGMFRVTVSGKDTHYLLMRNVQSYLPDMHTTYDLKGSDVGRDASEAEMEKLVPMFKDNDFKSHGRKLKLGGEGCRWFLNTLRQDAEFLASINMMDYSLLVGLRTQADGDEDLFQPGRDAYVFGENCATPLSTGGAGRGSPQDLNASAGASGGAASLGSSPVTPMRMPPGQIIQEEGCSSGGETSGGEDSGAEVGSPDPIRRVVGQKNIFFIGVVNVLTWYGTKKKVAHGLKMLSTSKETKKGLTTIDPEKYKERFMEFAATIAE